MSIPSPRLRLTRVLIGSPPPEVEAASLWTRGNWPAKWVTAPDASSVAVFRCVVTCDRAEKIRLHVSADERFELRVDGRLLARGPERGDFQHWPFESFDLSLPPGEHVLAVRVTAWGEAAPYATMSRGMGLLVYAEGDAHARLSTGVAPWEATRVRGLTPHEHPEVPFDGFTGRKFTFDARRYPFGVDAGRDARRARWVPVRVLYPGQSGWPVERISGRTLVPATLAPQRTRRLRYAEVRSLTLSRDGPSATPEPNEAVPDRAAVEGLVAGAGPLEVPARTTLTALLDLRGYRCAYTRLTASAGAGARVEVAWAEALHTDPANPDATKGDRREVEGKHFAGFADRFLLDGGTRRRMLTPHWQAGRYVRLTVVTADEAVRIDRLGFEFTGYPLRLRRRERCDDAGTRAVLRLCRSTLRAGAHDLLTDSPYYEQLPYLGDCRLAALCHVVSGADPRPADKALRLFASSRLPTGLLESRYPCRHQQTIPPFSLIWIGMLRDRIRWRGDADGLVRGLIPTAVGIVDYFLQHRDPQTGLVRSPAGWNFLDWCDDFATGGVPPGGEEGGASTALNLQLAIAVNDLAVLHHDLGDDEGRDRYNRLRASLVDAVTARALRRDLWLLSDTPGGDRYSLHAQALWRLASPVAPADVADMIESPPQGIRLSKPTMYFTHYVLEALSLHGWGKDRAEARASRVARSLLARWYDLPGKGLLTTPEREDPARSDCHPWTAHPLYHFTATLCGIRPAGPGLSRVLVRPLPAGHRRLATDVPTPHGTIRFRFRDDPDARRVRLHLPDGVTGSYYHLGKDHPLVPGPNTLEFPPTSSRYEDQPPA